MYKVNAQHQPIETMGIYNQEGQIVSDLDFTVGDHMFGSGLVSVPGGENKRHLSVMSWHYYFPLFLYGMEVEFSELSSLSYENQ